MAKRLNKPFVAALTFSGFVVATGLGIWMVMLLQIKDPREFVVRAEAASADGDWAAAELYYRRAYGVSKDELYLVEAGEMAYQGGTEFVALGVWNQVKVQAPERVDARQKLLDLYLEWARVQVVGPRHWAQVKDEAEGLLALDPTNLHAQFGRGLALSHLIAEDPHNFDVGLGVLEQVVKAGPEVKEYVVALTRMYMQQAQSIDPTKGTTREFNSAWAQIQEAEKLSRQLVELHPEGGYAAAEARWHLATLLDAMSAFLGTWNRDVDQQGTLRVETLGLYQEASELVGDEPKSLAEAKLELGQYWARQWQVDRREQGRDSSVAAEHFQTALVLMKESVDLNRDSLEAYRALASLYAQNGMLAEAVEVCSTRLELPIQRKGLRAMQQKFARYLLLLQAAEASIELARTLPKTAEQWGQVLTKAQQFVDDADAEYSGDALGIHLTGRIRLQQGHRLQALSLFHEAEEAFGLLDPNAPLYRKANLLNKLRLTELQLENGQLGAAKETILRAVLLAPESPDVWVTMGRVRLKMGEPELASHAADQALALAPGLPIAILVKADALRRLGRTDKVTELLRQLPQDSTRNLILQAEMLAIEGRDQEALNLLQPELDKAPAHPELVRHVVLSLIQLDNREAAQAVIATALQTDPDSVQLKAFALAMDPSVAPDERDRQQLELISEIPDAFNREVQYSLWYAGKGETENQLKHLQAAERLVVERGSTAAIELGARYLATILETRFALVAREKDWSTLEAIVRTAGEHNVDGADGKSFEGLLQMFQAGALKADTPETRKQQRDLWELAAAAFSQVRETQKTDSRNLTRLGQCLVLLERNLGALEALEGAVRANPKNAQAHRALAALAQKTGDREKYLEHLAVCEKLIPDNAWVQASVLAEREINDPAAGIPRREEVRNESPNDIGNLLRLASLYQRVGQIPEATRCYEDALAAEPNHQAIVTPAAAFFRQIESPKRAEELLRDFVASHSDPTEQAQAQLLVGHHFAVLGEVDSADVEFAKAADIKDTARVCAGLAQHYFRTGRYTEARQWQKLALERADPSGASLVAALMRMGIDCLLKLDEKEEAAREIDSYREAYPNDPAGWMLLSAVEARMGQLEDAVDHINRYIQARPEDPQGLYSRVHYYFSLVRWSAAIADLEQMRAQHPNALNLAPRIRLSQAYAVTGQEELAITELRSVSDSHPDAIHVSQALVELLFSLRRYAEAQQVLTSLINRFPDEPAWYSLRGRATYQAGDHPDAIADFRRAVEASDFLPAYVGELLDTYITEKRVSQGILFYEESVPQEQRTGAIQYRYAHLLALRGDTEQAVQIYRSVMQDESLGFENSQRLVVDASRAFPRGTAIELFESMAVEPELQEANDQILVGLLTVARRDTRGAELGEAQLLTASSELKRLLLLSWLGEIYSRTSEFEQAKHCYEETLAIRPDAISALNNLAYILADELDKPEQALAYAKKAAQLSERRGMIGSGADGDFAPIFDTLGWVYARLEQYANARGELSRAVQADPQFVPAYYHLGEVYRMQREFEQARQVLDRAMQIINSRSEHADTAYVTLIGESSSKIVRQDSN